ncbi:MAG: RtcB family protein [Candidatus Dadabacteria bacterium]|nr:MAG: RtcB family protein [Candidatus Dadabacteria bacterium]
MKRRELKNLGFDSKGALEIAIETSKRAKEMGITKGQLRKDLISLINAPEKFLNVEPYKELAQRVCGQQHPAAYAGDYEIKSEPEYKYWGSDIDTEAHKQMQNACSLPVSNKGALMPDAHVGYGLPIGGVLAVQDAVIPYAVGVDIACRVMITIYDIPSEHLAQKDEKYRKILQNNTRFGVGAQWERRKDHPVMGDKWGVSKVTKELKDKAWAQLGTSGAGNHFVEFGEFEPYPELERIKPGRYLALVSHSGSRGPGASVAHHFSKVARMLHPKLPKHLKHLAWLSLDSPEGLEYWECMELMGRYASANHHIIHEEISRYVGGEILYQVENHHNYAWKEIVDGKEMVVHRKGATPAKRGEVGYIPGTMIHPGYLVEGLGNPDSINSCSHGAGRALSRKAAKNSVTRYELKKILKEHGVELISAGLDEAPQAYKDIEAVMNEQRDLVKILGKFTPRIVKMAPPKER